MPWRDLKGPELIQEGRVGRQTKKDILSICGDGSSFRDTACFTAAIEPFVLLDGEVM